MPKTPDQRAVLIVEDDGAIRRLVRLVLERQLYQVETASDGVEAVLKLGLRDYDVIILDLMMPNLDGFAFIAKIAASNASLLKRIIVTSAASPSMIHDRTGGLPFAVLPKPFDVDALIGLVRDCAAQSV